MFLGLVPYEQLVYELTVGYGANLTYLYLLTLLVDVRFKCAFWTSELLVNALLLPFRIIIPDALRVAIMLTVFVFIPVAMTRGSVLYRLGMSGAIIAISVVGEFAMSYVFMVLTGQPYAQPTISEHLPAAFLGMLVMLAIGFVLVIALRVALHKFGVARKRRQPPMRLLAPMLTALLQPMLFLVILGSTLLPVSQKGGMLSVVVCAVSIIEIASVVLLYISSERYFAKCEADIYAAALQQGVQSRLEDYDAVIRSIEWIAWLRHDLRNQVQVAQALLSQDEVTRAHDIICDMVNAAKGKISA